MPKPKRKKQQYRILLTSKQLHNVNVEASSPEEACRVLQRKIGGKLTSETNVSSDFLESYWSNPTGNGGDDWIIAYPIKDQKKHPELMTWDGKKIHVYDVEEVIGDILKGLPKKE